MKERWIHPRASEGPDSGRKQARNWEKISSSHRPSKKPRLDYVHSFYASVRKRPSTPRDVGLRDSRRHGMNCLRLRKRKAEPPPNTVSQLLPDLLCKERSLATRSPHRAEHRGPKEPVCATVWFLRGSRARAVAQPSTPTATTHGVHGAGAPQPRVCCSQQEETMNPHSHARPRDCHVRGAYGPRYRVKHAWASKQNLEWEEQGTGVTPPTQGPTRPQPADSPLQRTRGPFRWWLLQEPRGSPGWGLG